MKSIESVGKMIDAKADQNDALSQLTESEAEERIQKLLEDESNSFLNEIKQNREYLDNAASAKEALAFAMEQIAKRDAYGTEMRITTEAHGIELKGVHLEGLKANVEMILKNAIEIGRGGDAFVVIDKNEVKAFPPEICYKFAIEETTPRGRNTTAVEAELQEQFYLTEKKLKDSKIGIPTPFYSLEIGKWKLIAMEKLHAASIEDIQRGKGKIPDWFDIDVFCKELEQVLNHFNSNGLYHRDMHLGNIMISQAPEFNSGDKMGYVIDFGLSGNDVSGLDPYKKEVAGATFTYNNDHVIMKNLQKVLQALKT